MHSVHTKSPFHWFLLHIFLGYATSLKPGWCRRCETKRCLLDRYPRDWLLFFHTQTALPYLLQCQAQRHVRVPPEAILHPDLSNSLKKTKYQLWQSLLLQSKPEMGCLAVVAESHSVLSRIQNSTSSLLGTCRSRAILCTVLSDGQVVWFIFIFRWTAMALPGVGKETRMAERLSSWPYQHHLESEARFMKSSWGPERTADSKWWGHLFWRVINKKIQKTQIIAAGFTNPGNLWGL